MFALTPEWPQSCVDLVGPLLSDLIDVLWHATRSLNGSKGVGRPGHRMTFGQSKCFIHPSNTVELALTFRG